MRYIKLLAFILTIGLIGGCAKINQDFEPGALSVGFSLRSYSYPTNFDETGEVAPLPLRVLTNVVPSQPVTLNYVISSPTGAEENVQYNDPNNGSMTIQPGSERFFTLDLDLLAAGYTGANENRQDTITVTLTAGEGYHINGIGSVSTNAIVFSE